MTKLKLAQKIVIYEEMLKIISSNQVRGFCAAFRLAILELGIYDHFKSIPFLKVLPELKEYQPHENVIIYFKGFWFDRYNDLRLFILKEIISKLKLKQLKNATRNATKVSRKKPQSGHKKNI